MTVLAIAYRSTNADLMVDCRDLGYIDIDRPVLDVTYGLGTFWRIWQPRALVASDIDPAKSPAGRSVNFTATGYPDEFAATVVLDPPYKLNGTPTAEVDDRYGVGGSYTTVAARHQLMQEGIAEAARILQPNGHLLFKCQDQVCSGRVHWQTRIMADHAETVGFRLVDALLFVGGRAQPAGRRQVHARRNYSTLLVLRKAAS